MQGLILDACLRLGWGGAGSPRPDGVGGARLRVRVQPPSRRGFQFCQTVLGQKAQRPPFLRLSFPCSLPAPRLSFLPFAGIFQLTSSGCCLLVPTQPWAGLINTR